MKWKYKIVEEKKQFSYPPQTFSYDDEPSLNEWTATIFNKYGERGWEVVHWNAAEEEVAYTCEVTFRKKVLPSSRINKSAGEIFDARGRRDLWNLYLDEG